MSARYYITQEHWDLLVSDFKGLPLDQQTENKLKRMIAHCEKGIIKESPEPISDWLHENISFESISEAFGL